MVTIVGSLLAAMGFFLSSFAPSLEVIYFTCGVLAGFGLSMPYVAGKIHKDRQMKVCEQSGAFKPAEKRGVLITWGKVVHIQQIFNNDNP